MYNIVNKINELEIRTNENISNSKSTNTLRAYRSDIKSYEIFCASLNLKPFPSEPKTVSLFITHISETCKYSTIKRKLAAIKITHSLSNMYLDLKNPIISQNLNGIKKKIGIFQRAKKPLSIEDLKKVVDIIDKEKKTEKKLRNKALILTGFCGAFRRSELVDLNIEDLDFSKEGVKIFIKKSKTDQSGEGMIKAIPYLDNINICPVTNLKKWINYLNSNNLNKKKIFDMSDKNVALIIKRYIKNIGLDPNKYSGHSLRSGFATATAENGAVEREIMSMTGHKSSQMVRRYIHEGNLFQNNALKKINQKF